MKKFLPTLIVTLMSAIIVACGGSSGTALKQTRNDQSFEMVVNIVPEDKITDTCTKMGVQYEANGCAAFNLDTKVCNIYVMPQRYQQDVDRLTIIGHEVWHCRFGVWHD